MLYIRPRYEVSRLYLILKYYDQLQADLSRVSCVFPITTLTLVGSDNAQLSIIQQDTKTICITFNRTVLYSLLVAISCLLATLDYYSTNKISRAHKNTSNWGEMDFWSGGYLKLPTTRLFVQHRLQATSKKTAKLKKTPMLCITGPLWGESTSDRWLPSQRARNVESVSMCLDERLTIIFEVVMTLLYKHLTKYAGKGQ